MVPKITLDLDLHTRTQITRPPTIHKGCQSFRPAVYERLNIQCSGSDEGKCKKVKYAENKVVLNNGGNMDLGTNGFTSDVSLPKDEDK